MTQAHLHAFPHIPYSYETKRLYLTGATFRKVTEVDNRFPYPNLVVFAPICLAKHASQRARQAHCHACPHIPYSYGTKRVYLTSATFREVTRVDKMFPCPKSNIRVHMPRQTTRQ